MRHRAWRIVQFILPPSMACLAPSLNLPNQSAPMAHPFVAAVILAGMLPPLGHFHTASHKWFTNAFPEPWIAAIASEQWGNVDLHGLVTASAYDSSSTFWTRLYIDGRMCIDWSWLFIQNQLWNSPLSFCCDVGSTAAVPQTSQIRPRSAP
jgi:hypothetical protein